MILRKPYAFFIKHFKLIHFVLFLATLYLIYETGIIFNFLSAYVQSSSLINTENIADTTITLSAYISVILVLLINITLLIVMIVKKKVKLIYIFNIIITLFTLVLFAYSQNILSILEKQLVSKVTVGTITDLLSIVIVLQIILSIFSFVRALGIGLKKFNFSDDLRKLDISEEDREEFELSFEFDFKTIIRKTKKRFTNIKYYFLERKAKILFIFFGLIVIIAGTIFINYTFINKHYTEKSSLTVNDQVLVVDDSYIVKEDVLGEKITLNKLVVVSVTMYDASKKDKPTLQTGSIELKTNRKIYQATKLYTNYLEDIGENYINQQISDEVTYILVFEIGINDKRPMLKLHDMGKNKNYMINLQPKDLSKKKKEYNLTLNETMNLSDTLLEDSVATITNYEIAPKFKVTYRLKISENENLDSYEYIYPKVNSNYNKTLLKIEGNLDADDNYTNVKSLADLFKYYATIKYIIDGQEYTSKNKPTPIYPTKVKQTGIYYIETDEEIAKASSITIQFNVRNVIYNYKLK